jgi:predicted RNase H-like nuclease (RuvC/YqgF family)
MNQELRDQNQELRDQNQELRDQNQIQQVRIDGLSKMIDEQAKITLDYNARNNARIFEEFQKLKKIIQDKDAQLEDLREQLIQIRKNEEMDRLEAKLGKTTKLPTHKPKEPSWWKEKERMDNRNKPKKPPGSKGYHNWAGYKPPGSKGRSHSLFIW